MVSVLEPPQKSCGNPVTAEGSRPTVSFRMPASGVTVISGDCIGPETSGTAGATGFSRTDFDSQSMAESGCCATAGAANTPKTNGKCLIHFNRHLSGCLGCRLRQIAEIGVARHTQKRENRQNEQPLEYSEHARNRLYLCRRSGVEAAVCFSYAHYILLWR